MSGQLPRKRWRRLANRVEHGLGQLVWLGEGAEALPPALPGWRRIEPDPQAPAMVGLLRALLESIDDLELQSPLSLTIPLASLQGASRGALGRLDPRLQGFAAPPTTGPNAQRLECFAEALADLLVQLALLRPTLLLLGDLSGYGRSFSVFFGQLVARSPASRLLVVFSGERPDCPAFTALREDVTRGDLLCLGRAERRTDRTERPELDPVALQQLAACDEAALAGWLLDLFCFEAVLEVGDPERMGQVLRGEALAGLGRHALAEECFLAAGEGLAKEAGEEQLELVLLRAENQWRADPADPAAVALLFDAVGELTAGLLDQEDFELYEKLTSGSFLAAETAGLKSSVRSAGGLARLFAALLRMLPPGDVEQAASVALHGIVLAAKLGDREILASLASDHAGLLLRQGRRALADELLRWVDSNIEGLVSPACGRKLRLQAARLAIAGAELERAASLLVQVGQGEGVPELAVACEAALLSTQVALWRGELRTALERGLATRLLLRNRNDPEREASCLLGLGRAYLLLGNEALAADCSRRCSQLRADVSSGVRLGCARLQAELAMAAGRLPEALPLLSPVLSEHDGLGVEHGLAWACLGTALIGVSGGDPAALQELAPVLQQALERCVEQAEAFPLLEPRVLRFQGLFLAVTGAREHALAGLEAAQQAGVRRGLPLEQARAALELARLRHIWRVGSALPLLEQAERLLVACGSQYDLRFLQQVRSQVFVGLS